MNFDVGEGRTKVVRIITVFYCGSRGSSGSPVPRRESADQKSLSRLVRRHKRIYGLSPSEAQSDKKQTKEKADKQKLSYQIFVSESKDSGKTFSLPNFSQSFVTIGFRPTLKINQTTIKI